MHADPFKIDFTHIQWRSNGDRKEKLDFDTFIKIRFKIVKKHCLNDPIYCEL